MTTKELTDMCIDEKLYFQIKLLRHYYCRLGFNHENINCIYFEKEKDSNKLNRCKYGK